MSPKAGLRREGERAGAKVLRGRGHCVGFDLPKVGDAISGDDAKDGVLHGSPGDWPCTC